MKYKKLNMGIWAFSVGIVLAIVISIISPLSPPGWAMFVLAVLGLMVGAINIEDKEIILFLVSSISFLISFQALSAVFTSLAFGWVAIETFFQLLTVFIVPATALVAMKGLYKAAKE